MDFSKFTFSKKYVRNEKELELSFDFDLKEITQHNRKVFDDCRSLLYYLQNNAEKKLFITLTQTDSFYEDTNKLVINLRPYQEFCKKIGQNGKNRTQAFLAQGLRHYSEQEKNKIIADSTEEEVIERIRNFTSEQKNIFLEKLKGIEGIELPMREIGQVSNEDFLKAFSSFLNDPVKQGLILNNYSQIQVHVLEGYKQFLEKISFRSFENV